MDFIFIYLLCGTLIMLVEQSDQWFYMRRFNGVGTNILTLLFWPVLIVVIIIGMISLIIRKGNKNG